ncbi:MAG: hypothetical protein ACXW3O_00200 [Brevundimonas sp.]
MKIKIFDIQNLAVAYVCLWATAPILAYGDAYRWAAAGAVALWAVLEMVRPGGIFARPTLPVVVTGLYIIYTVITEITLGPDGDIVRHVQIWIMLFFLVFYESRRHQVRSMAPIFWLILATLPMWLYSTYTAFDTFGSHASRLLTRSSDLARELTAEGVGGYSLVYGTVLMLPIFALLLLNVRRIIPIETPAFLRDISRVPFLVTALLTVNLVLGGAVVLRAGFSIAILLAVAALGLSIFFRKRSPVFLLFVPMAAIGGYLFLEVALIPTLNALKPLAEGTPYYRKILDIIGTLETDQSQGTFDDRWLRYERSVSLFLSNPLFGVISAADVGKHSAFLDTFARYGVFVGSGFVYLMVYLPIRMMKGMRDNFGLALSIFALMVLLPLVNDVVASLGVMLFVMTPVACDLVEQSRSRLPAVRPRRRPIFAGRGPAVENRRA